MYTTVLLDRLGLMDIMDIMDPTVSLDLLDLLDIMVDSCTVDPKAHMVPVIEEEVIMVETNTIIIQDIMDHLLHSLLALPVHPAHLDIKAHHPQDHLDHLVSITLPHLLDHLGPDNMAHIMEMDSLMDIVDLVMAVAVAVAMAMTMDTTTKALIEHPPAECLDLVRAHLPLLLVSVTKGNRPIVITPHSVIISRVLENIVIIKIMDMSEVIKLVFMGMVIDITALFKVIVMVTDIGLKGYIPSSLRKSLPKHQYTGGRSAQ